MPTLYLFESNVEGATRIAYCNVHYVNINFNNIDEVVTKLYLFF